MSTFLRSLASIVVGMTLGICGVSSQAAPPVKVDLATPASAEQDTVDLDVVITGSGFEPGAAVDFFVTGGETDKGNVVVTLVTYNDSKKLTAKVSLTNAKISDFDIKVTLMSGRNGKGISLFKVVAKGNARAADTTKPGVISNVQAFMAPRGIEIAFTATGDDGGAGQATRYRSAVLPWSGATCPALDATYDWADPSAHIRPYAAGTPDSVAWPDLDTNTAYCVGVEVVDEVGNAMRSGPFGPFSTSSPGSGAWSLTGISDTDLPPPVPDADSRSYLIHDSIGDSLVVRIHEDGVFLADADTSVALPNQGVAPRGTTTTAQATTSDVLSAYSSLYTGALYSRTTGVATIPGGGVAIVLRAQTLAGATVALFLEYRNGTWDVQVLPWDPGTNHSDGSGNYRSYGGVSILYMGGQPILTYTVESGNQTQLYVAQRSIAGWPTAGTLLLTRQKTRTNAVMPSFNTGALVDASSGGYSRLGLWLNTSNDGAGGLTNGVYLVRCDDSSDPFCAGSSDGWVWYDTGNTSSSLVSSLNDKAGIDMGGNLRIVNMRSGTPNVVQTIGQGQFGARTLGLNGAATSRLSRARETINSGVIQIDGLALDNSGYHVAVATKPAASGRGYARSSVNVCGNGSVSTELVTYSEWPEGNWEGKEVQKGPVIFVYHTTDGVLLARRTTATCP